MGWSSIGWASLSSTLVPLLLVSSPKTTRGDVQPSQTLTDIPEMSYVTKSCLAEGDLATFFRGIHYTSAQGRALLQGLNAGRAIEQASSISRKLELFSDGESWGPRIADGLVTLGNTLMLAIEEDMRSHPCSSRRSCNLRDEVYVPVVRWTLWCLYKALDINSHYGAHYSVGILIKIYPSLVAAATMEDINSSREESSGCILPNSAPLQEAAAFHLCASHAAYMDSAHPLDMGDIVYSWGSKGPPPQTSHSPSNVSFTTSGAGLSGVEVIPIAWVTPSPDEEEQEVVLVSLSGSGDDLFYVEGPDAIIHDLMHSPTVSGLDLNGVGLGTGTRKAHGMRQQQGRRDLEGRRRGSVYLSSSHCYPRLYAQLGLAKKARHIPSLATVAGFSGGEYYHWLLEGLSRLLLLRQALLSDEKKLVTLDWRPKAGGGTRGRAPSTGAELLPPRAGLEMIRRTLVAEALTTQEQTLLVLVYRNPQGKRGMVNHPDVVEALKRAADMSGLEFVVFDGVREGVAGAVKVFSRARAVVGVHGAGLANCVFCRSGTALIEIRLPEPEFNMFQHLAAALDLFYVGSEVLSPNQFESRVFVNTTSLEQAVYKAVTKVVQAES